MDAVVVGSGPNGLAAALVLAKAGLRVQIHEARPTLGGGTRTAELTLPGLRHDVCSAVHPLGLASPFFRAIDLAAHGVDMLRPEVSYAHPLDGAQAGVAYADLNRTVDGLGVDGPAWRNLFGPLVQNWQELVDTALSDTRHVPAALATAVQLGLRVMEQGSPAARFRFRSPTAPAMFAGVGAHALAQPRAPGPAGVGLVLGSLAHAVGWPIPRGGSQTITNAVEAELRRSGVRIVTDHAVQSLRELPASTVVLLDVAPSGLLDLASEQLPARYVRQLRSFRHGTGACKVDFALSGPVPWAATECARAGTVHLGGTSDEIRAVERATASGRHVDRPFVLAVQPDVVDDTRRCGQQRTLWTYAHVPPGSTVDVSEAVTHQIERFAPGFRDLVLDRHVITAADWPAYNANYVGGDIAGGAMTTRQILLRPANRWDPYATPLTGVYLCSASTPPGTGVHGMSGVHAAGRALRQHFDITGDPLELLRPEPSG